MQVLYCCLTRLTAAIPAEVKEKVEKAVEEGKEVDFVFASSNPATVTANINFEGYAFALIYKD